MELLLKIWKIIGRIFSAIIIMAIFAFFAYTMYTFDQLEGRQFAIVVIVSGLMVGIFGKTVAAIITLVLGAILALFTLFSKDDDDEDKEKEPITPKKL